MFSTFLSRKLYGCRPRFHHDAYMASPGWLFIELGDWTLEVEWPAQVRIGTPCCLRTLLLGVGGLSAGVAAAAILPETWTLILSTYQGLLP